MARINPVQYVSFYTAGSAAYQLDPAPVHKKKAQLPKLRRRKRIVVRLDPVAALGVVVCMVMLVMMISGLVQLGEIRAREAKMEAYVQTLQEKNAQLEQTYREGYDLEEIREIALAMGMVPGSQAEHIQVSVNEPITVQEPTPWENFCMFLTGLFA